MTRSDTAWRLPVARTHVLSGSAGVLSFVGGAGDFDATGRTRNPGNLFAQIPGTLRNLDAALASEACSLADVMRLKVYYQSDGSQDEWALSAALADAFAAPLPAISLIPVPLQPFPGQALQIQAIAQRRWRDLPDVRVDPLPIPDACSERFPSAQLTSGLRAGEFIVTASRTATPDAGGDAADAPAQTHAVMRSLEATLSTLGATLQDTVKMEGYYFGTTREHWVPMAEVRGSYFREPGPPATVVPCHVLWPAGAATRIEVLAMRCTRGGFDKYIPRDDCWPERVWDWPIPLPYRQAIRLRDTVWLGGQVPARPFDNSRERVLPGELHAQTAFTMSYVEDLLRGFGRRPADLKLMVCYFKSAGTPEETARFVASLADCVDGALPPLTLVPQPHLHTPESTVEIWGVAVA